MQYYEVNSTNVTIITDILNTAPGALASLPGNATTQQGCYRNWKRLERRGESPA